MPVFSNFQQIYQRYMPNLRRLAAVSDHDSPLRDAVQELDQLNQYYDAWMGLGMGRDLQGKQTLIQITAPRSLDKTAVKELDRRMRSVQNCLEDLEDSSGELGQLATRFLAAVESDKDALARAKPQQDLQQLFREQHREEVPMPISEEPLDRRGAIVDHQVTVQQQSLGRRQSQTYHLRLRIQKQEDFDPNQLRQLERYDALGQLLGREQVLELYERQYAEIQGQPTATIAFSLGTREGHEANRRLLHSWAVQGFQSTVEEYRQFNPPEPDELINGRDPKKATLGDYAIQMLEQPGQWTRPQQMLLEHLPMTDSAAQELLDIQVMDFLLGQKRNMSGLELQFQEGPDGPKLQRVKAANNANVYRDDNPQVSDLAFVSPHMAQTLARLSPEELAARLSRTGLEGQALEGALERLAQLQQALAGEELQVLENARQLRFHSQQVENSPLLGQLLLQLPRQLFLRQEGMRPESLSPLDSDQLKPLPQKLHYENRPDLQTEGYQGCLRETLGRLEKSFRDAHFNSREFTGMRNALHSLVEGSFQSLEELLECLQTLKQATDFYISQKSSAPRTVAGRQRLSMALDLSQTVSQLLPRLEEAICYRDQREYRPEALGLPLEQAQDPLALRLRFAKEQAVDRLSFMVADGKRKSVMAPVMTEYLFYVGLERDLAAGLHEQVAQALEPRNRAETLATLQPQVLAWMRNRNIEGRAAFIEGDEHGRQLYGQFGSFVQQLKQHPEITARQQLHQALKDSEREVIRALEEDPQRVAEPMARYLCLKALEANGDEKVIYHGLKQESLNTSVSAMLPGVSRWLNNMGREESQPVDLQSSNLYRSFLIFQANEQKRIETSLNPTAVQSLQTKLEQEEEERSDDAVIATLGIG